MQLERLVSATQPAFAALAPQPSLAAGAPPPPLFHQRSSSLAALVQQQQQAAAGGPEGAQRGRQNSGTLQGSLLGKLGMRAGVGSRERGSAGPASLGGGSARSSATSLGLPDAQAELAELQQRQTSSFSAAAAGPRKGSGNRIAPEDAV